MSSRNRFRRRSRIGGITDRTDRFDHEPDLKLRRKRVYDLIDEAPFQKYVVFVAGAGFFTDSYAIFAVNSVIPMLSFVYWDGEFTMPAGIRTMLLCALLAGSMVGQLVFGVLGDWLGRKKMYGWLLVIIIWGTLGLTVSAQGAQSSMSISALLFVWRFFMGIGIGGDYPLSAALTSEFAPTEHRSTMLAWLFFMQPAGQFVGTILAVIVTAAFKSKMQIPWEDSTGTPTPIPPDCIRAVDRAWRLIVGLGAVPALIALVVRLGIPESPRFTMDILFDTNKAVQDAEGFFVVAEAKHATSLENDPGNGGLLDFPLNANEPAGGHSGSTDHATENPSQAKFTDRPGDSIVRHNSPIVPASTAQMNRETSFGQANATIQNSLPLTNASPSRSQDLEHNHHLSNKGRTQSTPKSQHEDHTLRKILKWTSAFLSWLGSEENGKHLAGTTLTWGLLDFSFYGLGMSSASTIQQIWDGRCANDPSPGRLTTREGGGSIPTIYHLLFGNSWHSTIVVSLGALSGGLILIYLIQRMRPKLIQTIFFAVLGLFLIIVGAVFKPLIGPGCQHPSYHWGVVVLYVFCQLFFNLGANATTYIIPAVTFPTRYRCTCHGISAAGGKLGSVIAQLAIGLSRSTDNDPTNLGWWLIGLGFLMLLGSGVTWWAVPETRDAQGNNIPLQDMEEEIVMRGWKN